MAQDENNPRETHEEAKGPSRQVDAPYSAGHTGSRGIPDEDQSIVENIREQQQKDEEPRASGWHGDPGVPEGEPNERKGAT